MLKKKKKGPRNSLSKGGRSSDLKKGEEKRDTPRDAEVKKGASTRSPAAEKNFLGKKMPLWSHHWRLKKPNAGRENALRKHCVYELFKERWSRLLRKANEKGEERVAKIKGNGTVDGRLGGEEKSGATSNESTGEKLFRLCTI